ncbi:protein mono-ADP-ribosyltransferase PARP14-like [Saccostrea cucullata]|uniref:protein mono-ADP-ribosyltransferase PARP14-like n=1 Tax=Saccostrea cuccullata TaxID=36930 RepID=UPI002ED04E46
MQEPELPPSSTEREKQPPERRCKVNVESTEIPSQGRSEERTPGLPEEEEETDEGTSFDTVRVRLSKPMSQDAIENYFENTRKSGGGDIQFIKIMMEEDEQIVEALITFRQSSDAKSCLERRHTIIGQTLTVEKYDENDPEMWEMNKVLVTNLHPETTDDTLMNFLEPAAGVDPIEVVRGSKSETVIVLFDEKPDFSKMSKRCNSRKLHGKSLFIRMVEKCRSVYAQDIDECITYNAVENFFCNKRRSGGGEVEEMDYHPEDGYCVVLFKNPTDAENVASREKVKINGKEIRVQMLYSQLGLPEQPINWKDLPSMSYPCDKYFIKFVKYCEVVAKEIEKTLQQKFVTVEWPKSKSDFNVKLHCSLTKEVENARGILKKWKEEAEKSMEGSVGKYVVQKHSILPEAWENFLDKLKMLDIYHPEKVAVSLESKQHVAVVVGFEENAEALTRKILDIVKTEEMKIKIQKEKIEKNVPLDFHKCQQLWKTQYQKKLKAEFPDVDMNIEIDKKEVNFSGKSSEVNEALIKMHEYLMNTKSKSLSISKGRHEVFKSKEVRDIFLAEMKTKNNKAVWIVTEDKVEMTSSNMKMVEEALKLFEEFIPEKAIKVKQLVKVLTRDEWQACVKKLRETHVEKLYILTSSSEVRVTSTKDIFQPVCTEVEQVLKECSKKCSVEEHFENFWRSNKKRSSGSFESHDARSKPKFPVKMAECDLHISGKMLIVMKGDVTKMTVDVIVNATNGGLNHFGGLFLAISRAGGDLIQRECEEYIRINGTVQNGDAIPAKPGNLPCKMLIHAVGPRWTGGNYNEEIKLRQAILKCLELTDRNSYCSIAIPALSAGILGYPVDQSVDIIVSSVQLHFKSREGKDSKIKEIFFCGVDDKIVTAFIRCLRKRFGQDVKEFYGDKDMDAGERKIGELNVEVRQGDITKENTDAIVSCISESLDFSIGAVSRAVLRAAGDRILAECRREARSFSSEDFVVTSGGNMDCKYIIHVKGQLSAERLERMVAKALAHADKTGCRSISFPALGTGVADIDPAEISQCMFRAISKYYPLNLQRVRIIVFQSKMFPVFKSTLHALSQVEVLQKVDMGFDDKDETIRCYPYPDKNLFHGNMMNRGQTYRQRERDGTFMVPSHLNYKESSDFDRKSKNEYEWKEIDTSKCMLRDNQIDEIKRLAKDTKLIVKYGKIELLGLAANVNEAAVSIYKYLHEVKDKESAKRVQEYVKWQYEAWSDKWITYREDVNLQIENAHQARMDSIIVKDNRGTEYVIDFKKMEERFPVELPTTWTCMTNNHTVLEITLNHWDNEYHDVMSKFMVSSKRTVSISEIRRVQNPYLYQQYVTKRKEIEVKNGKDPQKWLWHGTYPDTLDKIINNGFNRGYCGRNGTRYGAGVYFAVHASYSVGYCRPDSNGLKHMFSVQVATGDVCEGKSSMNVLPPKPGAGSHVTYDSASDNPFNPEMYVIFHDSQAYPTYHIIFR